MSRRDPQFNVRIPQELKDKVVTLAGKNKRSVNAEIVAALEYVCRRAFGDVIDHGDDVEIILNENDSAVLKSCINTFKKVEEAEQKLDAILTELKKMNA